MLRPAVCRIVCCVIVVAANSASAQLNVLSKGNPASDWRKGQLEQLAKQLADEAVEGPLREELQAQQKWLEAWLPGKLTDQPMWEADVASGPPITEPVLDPQGSAAELRERLLGESAQPTTAETDQLQRLLAEHPRDVGLRQLQLQWLDQPQYRKLFPDEIADTARLLVELLDEVQPASSQVQQVRQFCLYRQCRALIYRELPEVLKEKPLVDPQQHESALIGAYRQLVEAAGTGRPEFILVEIRMLRREGFFGRGLVLLTDHGRQIDHKWFLKKRRDLLREMGWELPAREAAAVYAAKFPDEVAAEAKQAEAEAE